MSIEEKAKAYDEALERARPLYEQAKRDGNPIRSTYEYLIPELHEEEKPLTPFQQCLNCILRGVYYAEVPDKKVNEFIVNVVRTRTDELIELAKKQEEQKPLTAKEYHDKFDEIYGQYKPNLVEQKPAEWSEEDEK